MIVLFAAGVFLSCVQPPSDEGGSSGNLRIQSLTADPPVIDVGYTSTITVVATDRENRPLTYRWSASTGDIIGEGASVRFSASLCCRGPNYIQVTVKNNVGGSTTQLVDVFINY